MSDADGKGTDLHHEVADEGREQQHGELSVAEILFFP